MSPVRVARIGALAVSLLALSSAPALAAAPAPATAAAGKHWHRQVALGKGKRAAKVFTCSTGTAGNVTAWFKLSTRSSSDRSYPRVEIDMVEGSHTASREVALMPGNRTETFDSSPWSASGAVTIKVFNQGKRKTKRLTVGAFGRC